ncbi:NAD(P)(+) transhydrogenase (Re/Si-specific) subunit beta [Polyangium jinanense]|uniref:NAD(P) transhydrogenase subunit beta n=1 Tax=Polyangium jinanense TaxID=2829994 RepID=A0A9X3XB81_9BACT|nr:NAD(P)(+) transhydrogenase (Re/Si-specific) subunit beta [Polyangium jinanense]MDC3956992.1 NAD(P)(+) transhydrogenase (Re/Si-specific) subunit beta [Polyangium jinanense]MDC3987149.1 NAD(P)(+) transhydrogenase (Re/Si-specific) subunit beta [Polyangium jinanense]
MRITLVNVAYLVASLLFVMSLRGLSTQQTARRGNLLGTVGMLLAVAVTLGAVVAPENKALAAGPSDLGLLAAAIGVGAVIGAVLAARVAMTSMPELVAVLHSFVGAAAALVGIASEMNGVRAGGAPDVAHHVEIHAGVFIGAITFTGSVIAFLKLRGTIGSKPLVLPARHALNASMVFACIFLAIAAFRGGEDVRVPYLLVSTGVASVLGAHLVLAIGGGDMPVVVSLLNSYSGWAASAAGFMLGNDLLIVTGALVGSSGAILSYIMCKAMNRSIWNVVFAGFGEQGGAVPAAKKGEPAKKVNETSIDGAADLLLGAKNVIVVPGYGMAVAQAQHAVKEITTLLERRGTKARYAIHPVAGRLPGHMNVLLAEANVSYEAVKEMEEINEDFEETDVVIVIGANDIVNPSALDDPESPIYGMPVLEVWKAGRVIMLKRGMAAGYAGVDNPLCYLDNTLMLFGDAKASVQKLLSALSARAEQQAA